MQQGCFVGALHLLKLTQLVWLRRSDRLDWMYQGGMLAKQEAEKRQEEAMMTGKPLQQTEDTELDRVSMRVLLPNVTYVHLRFRLFSYSKCKSMAIA